MKISELIKLLKKNNCKLYRHKTNHDEWINLNTGNTFLVPRHFGKEVKSGTLDSILKEAGIKEAK